MKSIKIYIYYCKKFKKISRTNFGSLPVYKDYANKRSIKRTEIRRIEGDIDTFV